jgi:uncharacterized protein YyaL (SSP411 family)
MLGASLPLTAAGTNVRWYSWGAEAFAAAERDDKLILLDVGTEWCSACNQMQHETYTDSEVRRRLAERFITIHVDAEAQPDLGERYGFWGWPALIFIAPDGRHVGFYRGFRPPESFAEILTQLDHDHRGGQLDAPDVDVDLVSEPVEDDFEHLVKLGDAMLDRFYDTTNHGWSGARMPDPFLLQQAWWRGEGADQSRWSERALATSALYRKMLDPVWGGIWFGSRAADFSGNFIHERRAEHQAGALTIFARALTHSGDSDWRDAIDSVVRYLDTFLRADDGGFYTSQEMHIIVDGVDITPDAYFSLDDHARRAIGMPAIDTTRYTDINAKLVLAFAELYEATGEEAFKRRALNLMHYVNGASNGKGGYRQIIATDGDVDRARRLPDDEQNVRYLRTQAFAGLAALASFGISGDEAWLKEAHTIAEVIVDSLREPQSGGLLGSTRSAPGPGGTVLRDQPLVDTGAAVDFLNRLWSHTYGAFEAVGRFDSKQYRKFAEYALRAVARPERLRVQGNFIGQYVLALHQWYDEFIQVSVVCPEPGADACRELHTIALTRLGHPRRIVKVQRPGYYPARGPAALFICNSLACSTPLTSEDPKMVIKVRTWYDTLDGSAG